MNWRWMVLVPFLWSCSPSAPTHASFSPPGSRPTADQLLPFVQETANALRQVTDEKSAKAQEDTFSAWRQSIFLSRDPADREWIGEKLSESESLAEALGLHEPELKRINDINTQLFDTVLEMITGRRPGTLKASLELTAKVLNQVRSEQDLDRLESELRKAYQPIREEMEDAAKHGSENLMAFNRSLRESPETKGPMAAQSAALTRLQSNQVLARKVGEIMMGTKLMGQIDSFRGEATSNALLAQSKLMVFNVQMAVTMFYNEYNSYPSLPNKTAQDQVTMTNEELTAILQGTHPSGNRVAFLDSKEPRLVDAWGNPIRVIMDTNRDDVVNTPAEYGSEVIKKGVITDSSGPDGKFETIEDNLVSWKN